MGSRSLGDRLAGGVARTDSSVGAGRSRSVAAGEEVGRAREPEGACPEVLGLARDKQELARGPGSVESPGGGGDNGDHSVAAASAPAGSSQTPGRRVAASPAGSCARGSPPRCFPSLALNFRCAPRVPVGFTRNRRTGGSGPAHHLHNSSSSRGHSLCSTLGQAPPGT